MQALQLVLMFVSLVIGLSQAVKEVRPMMGPITVQKEPEYLYRYSDAQYHYYSDASSHYWCRVTPAGVKEYATIP